MFDCYHLGRVTEPTLEVISKRAFLALMLHSTLAVAQQAPPSDMNQASPRAWLEKTEMKDAKEGSTESQGTKGKDAGTIAGSAGAGALFGSVATRVAGVGGLLGAGAELATVLLTRGLDVRIGCAH